MIGNVLMIVVTAAVGAALILLSAIGTAMPTGPRVVMFIVGLALFASHTVWFARLR